MNKPRCVLAALLAIFVSSAGCASIQPPSVERDLQTIMSWWNGDYDNDRQVARLIAAGSPIWREDDSGKGGHIEVTSHYRPVNLPAFGDKVIYVEETKYGDPTSIFRQRIYTLRVDEEAGQGRVKLWNFKDKTRYVGAWSDLSMLDELTPDEMSALPDNCDLHVRRDGEKFHMPMNGSDCAFGDRYFNYQVLLGPDSFWFRDKIVRVEDDEILTTSGDFTYHELDKQP